MFHIENYPTKIYKDKLLFLLTYIGLIFLMTSTVLGEKRINLRQFILLMDPSKEITALLLEKIHLFIFHIYFLPNICHKAESCTISWFL